MDKNVLKLFTQFQVYVTWNCVKVTAKYQLSVTVGTNGFISRREG